MKLKTAIRADLVKIDKPLGTYANILLRPQHRRGVKDSPIVLRGGEIHRIRHLNGEDAKKWNWICGSEHAEFIYTQYDTGVIKITSISGYYSGTLLNKFSILGEWGNWYLVQTLKAGSDWWTKAIPAHLLHNVYCLSRGGKLNNPPCGSVVLPVISRSGTAWIEKWQVR